LSIFEKKSLKTDDRIRPEQKLNLSKSAMRRYKVIDSLLRNTMRKYPTMEEIIEACFEKLDYYPSVETIQKDIRNMKMDTPMGFGAPIRFSRLHMGYEYTDPNYTLTAISLQESEIETIQKAIELIKAIGGSRIGDKFNHAIQKVISATLENNEELNKLPVLQTMHLPVSKGFEHFDLFYKACNEKIPVSIIHFSYTKRIFKHIKLHPFLIKEFDNRWYLIGYSEHHNEVRTFGMDRISMPVLLKKEFIPSNYRTVYEFLNDMYGVFPIANMEKTEIKLHVRKMLTHYLHAYPIHPSQKIEKQDDGDSIIKFDLIPTVELARYVLSNGQSINIISPIWFREFTNKLR
jgi:predicted DNA-binding transcriptional regulator YafY